MTEEALTEIRQALHRDGIGFDSMTEEEKKLCCDALIELNPYFSSPEFLNDPNVGK